MKRTLTIFGLVSISLLLLGFRGSGYRGDRTLSGDYTFSDAIDVDSLDTDHLVVNTTADFNGAVDVNDKSLWIKGDSLFFTDGGADTNGITNDGSYLKLFGDNEVYIFPTLNIRTINPISDTLYYCGYSAGRFKEVWALRLQWTDGTKADSGKIYDNGTSTFLKIDNALFRVITGTDTVSIGSSIAGTKLRGTDTFGATFTSDTVLITGAGATDYYWIQIKGATVTTSPFTYTAAAGSLIVFCAEGDTSVARASGYNWLRMQ